jgi:hypothetical protein
MQNINKGDRVTLQLTLYFKNVCLNIKVTNAETQEIFSSTKVTSLQE